MTFADHAEHGIYAQGGTIRGPVPGHDPYLDGAARADEQLADLANRLAEIDGLDPSPVDFLDTFTARVDQLVADHVEPARIKALE